MLNCVYCGDPAAHLDHVIPRSDGGEDAYSNRAPACAPCNLSKSAKPLARWLADAILKPRCPRGERIRTRLISGEIEGFLGAFRSEWVGGDEVDHGTLANAVLNAIFFEVDDAVSEMLRVWRIAKSFGSEWDHYAEYILMYSPLQISDDLS